MEQKKAEQTVIGSELEHKLAAKKETLEGVKSEIEKIASETKGAKAAEAAFDKEHAAITREVHKSEACCHCVARTHTCVYLITTLLYPHARRELQLQLGDHYLDHYLKPHEIPQHAYSGFK